MGRQQLPIWRDANRLLVEVETVVRSFSRYHKYSLGTDLRKQAMNLCRLISVALRDLHHRATSVERLILAIDDIKVLIQLGKEIKAYQNFSQFQRLVELAVSLGKQGGAWLRHLSGKNGQKSGLKHEFA